MSDTEIVAETGGAVIAPEVNESETEARRLGWVPKDEFKGDPDKWRPAEEFLDRGKRILPILQRDNEKLHKRVSEMETLVRETQEAAKQLVEFNSKAEQRAYERARADLESRIEQAATNADPVAARAATRELAELEKQHKPEPKTEAKPQQLDPVIQSWIAEERWFNTDRTLQAFAVETFGELERSSPGMAQSERLAETKKRVVSKFPEKFGMEQPAKPTAAAVATPAGNGSAPRRNTKKGYDDLPDDAKKACDRFVKMIPGYTRDQYVKDYDWDN
jgi:cell division septum initiation protein DivIVA